MNLKRTGLLGLLLIGVPASAQPVTSSGPESVSISIYRDPNRSADDDWDLDWLEGYALVTETRRVSIPAGEGEIRFEGVAGGILPESAIVTGLPDGVIEKNQDADLLSPRSLLDRSTGRRATIRRTSKTTGKVTEEDAIIRSGGDGGIVLQTRAGIEALQCSGLRETLVYDSVPPGLSAKPTLSVRTRSRRAGAATVTLSYLAAGFDWQANYVAELAPDGTHMDLFAWVTLASGDETSFARANTQAIAGRPNRESDTQPTAYGNDDYLSLQCWPAGTTTSGLRPPPPPALPPPPAPLMRAMPPALADIEDASSIIVTATRVVQEDLGDLKLYRVPEPVTVAAHSQKQVALLAKQAVPVALVYRTRVDQDDSSATLLIRARNREADGLGLPLPSGKVALFQRAGGQQLLVGEGTLDDKAVGEEVEIELAEATQVTVESETVDSGQRWRDRRLTVSNALPESIAYEAEFRQRDGEKLEHFSEKLRRKDGKLLWSVAVPANGTVVLGYRVRIRD